MSGTEVKKYHGITEFLSYGDEFWQKQRIMVLVCVSDMCRCRALYDGDTVVFPKNIQG